MRCINLGNKCIDVQYCRWGCICIPRQEGRRTSGLTKTYNDLGHLNANGKMSYSIFIRGYTEKKKDQICRYYMPLSFCFTRMERPGRCSQELTTLPPTHILILIQHVQHTVSRDIETKSNAFKYFNIFIKLIQ